MSEDETNFLVKAIAKKLSEQTASAPTVSKPERKPGKEVREWVNLAATLAIGPLIALCWYAVSQHIDLTAATIVSNAKDTYVDKPTFAAAAADINAHIGRQEQHIDVVDERENADREKHDLEIQQLQDKEGGAIGRSGAAPQAWNVVSNNFGE